MFSYLEASRLLGVPLEFPADPGSIRSFSIDSRTLIREECFVALRGERSDGHQFLENAYRKGASGALIDARQRETVLRNVGQSTLRNILAVRHPEAAMARLAADYRGGLSVSVVGITGSVGKTTTKEFLCYLLRGRFPTIATEGNLNNHLGVPIMLSKLEPEHRYCVLEMGASHRGEIRHLAGLSKPMAAILTPIGPAHLEGFGSLANVYRTKIELAEALPAGAPLVIPADDKILLRRISETGLRAVTVGYGDDAAYRISEVSVRNGEVFFALNKRRFSFPGQASFLTLNAGLALAMARSLGMAWDDFPESWGDAGFAAGRFHETILFNGLRVIDDTYNANPVSFENALKAFRALPRTGKKVVVFADMLELGGERERFHRELGEKIALTDADFAWAYGEGSRWSVEAVSRAKTGCDARHFDDPDALFLSLKDILRPGDVVLFKGSRGMHVEKVLASVATIAF
ncbi:MAG: UDP-N-acetylmuramoyl-tripeptide--D-alanyl-D-alanine ligase [Candidatus Omnitrophica bacterium]|nr:UDP-N-acetylmuramoyl-tripeptide--D-alanyl-D-alanine ligase [Candidatus Omnitrophota bacterium]